MGRGDSGEAVGGLVTRKDARGAVSSRSSISATVEREELLLKSPSSVLAAEFHEDWRAERLLEDGTFEPRIKTTKDEDWIKQNGTDQVDIANTSYADLPSDWQEENHAAAQAALDAVLENNLEEDAAFAIHEAWLERNGDWAEEGQKLPYDQLAEEEKDKDRLQVRAAKALIDEQASFFENLVEQDITERERAVDAAASLLHDDWREARRVEDGQFFEPRIKTTKDEGWIEKNGTDQVDIANTEFKDLPLDWQEENRAAAEAAMEAISKADNVEEAAALIHDAWLQRNGEWAEDHQKVPYAELSEEEKEKDRLQVLAAIDASSEYHRPADPGLGDMKSSYIRPTLEAKMGTIDKERLKQETEALASHFHNDWRRTREGVAFEPRIKTTKDEDWAEKNGTDQVDIANTSYADLPSDWQAENKAAAEAAYKAVKESRNIEEASSKIHDAWLERNGEWAEDHQKVPYEQLSEEEKEKDRLQARLAINAVANPNLSLVEYPEGQEPRPGELREGVIRGGGRHASSVVSLLSQANQEFDQARSGFRFALDFSDEGRAIAEYAKSKAQESGDNPVAIIEEVGQNPEKYESEIPEVAENRSSHSGFSWGTIAIGTAMNLVGSDPRDPKSEGNKNIQGYIKREEARMQEASRALQVQKRAADQAARRLAAKPGREFYAEDLQQAANKEALKSKNRHSLGVILTHALQESYKNSQEAEGIIARDYGRSADDFKCRARDIERRMAAESNTLDELKESRKEVFDSGDLKQIEKTIAKLTRRLKRYDEARKEAVKSEIAARRN